jgi:NUMOD4 motif
MRWGTVKEIPSYAVSSTGIVKRTARGMGTRVGKVIKPQANKRGYLYVVLCEKGKPLRRAIHRLVALAFIPNPKNLLEVNHKKRPVNNCNVSNLEWCSSQGNKDHAVRLGYTRGDGVHYNKATKKWTARHSLPGYRNIYLGEYASKEVAKRVRDAAVKSKKASIPI